MCVPPDAAGPVRLLSLFRLRDDRLPEAEGLLATLVEHAAQEPLCRGVELLRDTADQARCVLQFDFDSAADLQAYLGADWRQELLQGVLDLLSWDVQRLVLAPAVPPVPAPC